MGLMQSTKFQDECRTRPTHPMVPSPHWSSSSSAKAGGPSLSATALLAAPVRPDRVVGAGQGVSGEPCPGLRVCRLRPYGLLKAYDTPTTRRQPPKT